MTRCRRLTGRVIRAALVGVLAVAFGVTTGLTARAEPPGQHSADGPTAVARARVAADVLMNSYDPDKAWFPSSWWNSAVALETIGDYMQRTGDRRYLPQLDNTFEKDKGAFPPGELSGDPLLGNFTSRAIDDSEWWGLTWVQAYDLTGEQKYLDMAEKIATFAYGYWDPSTCGGGVWWNAERTYKNAVTNGLFIRLTAELHNRIHGDKVWLARSQQAWDWFVNSGLINSDHLVNDGLTDNCTSNHQTVWSYNQGLAIGAAVELWRATHDPALLRTARQLADAAMRPDGLTTDGVLTEACDAPDQTCDDNAKQFKGIFLRYFSDLADTTHDQRYAAYVDRQAETIWTKDRDAANRLGTRWSGRDGNGSHPNVFDWRSQASALSALIADVPQPAPNRSLAAAMSPARPVVMPARNGNSTISMDLSVSATARGARRVTAHTSVQSPDGWSIAPRTDVVTLRPRGIADPAYGSVPVTITVPASATDGHHAIDATVTARPQLRFSTQADVLVAHTIDFDTGTAAEAPWLWDADGSQSNGVQNRFADGTHYFVYRFPFPADTTAASVTLTIDNEYLVQVSADGKSWTTMLTEKTQEHDGNNKAARTVDLSSYLGPDKASYVRVADSFPQDGWGGRVYHVKADYTE